MENILKKLNIRPNEKSVFFNFFLFNLILYAGVFLGRAIRDALFFSKIGADYLPLVFIANAISMSIFGTYFAKWTGKGSFKKLRKVSFTLFAISAAFIFLFSILFSLDLTGTIPQTNFPLENIVIILFYWSMEIPIFLMLVVIWIIADNYISESMGQRLNPKIIGGGHIGIVIGGIIAVFAPSLFNIEMQSLTYVLVGIVALEALMVLVVYKFCKPLPRELEEEKTEAIEEMEKTGFWKDLKDSFKVVKKYKFSVYFALIALFNFFLFGINDYMLNSRAIDAGISADQLVFILGIFTIGFGIFSAFFQFTFLTKIIKKFGIAKANLGGAIIFVIGFSILLLTSTHMFKPVQEGLLSILKMGEVWLLLYSIALVRFGGFIAEYLFNQSMLPALYGAVPGEDREVTRTFIEGTFVQMIYGFTGIFLILYRIVFDKNLDLLILLGAVAASLMLIYCWLLIAQYKDMIKLSKQSIKEQILSKVIGAIDKKKVQSLFNKGNTFITTSLIEFLSKNKKQEFVEDIFNQFGKKRVVNIAVIDAIIELNNLEYFDRLVNKFIEFEANSQKLKRFKRSDTREIRNLLSGFYRMHHSYDVFSMFEGIESNPNCTAEYKQEIIYFLSKLDNKNGIIVANKILENLDDKKLAMRLSAEIGFDNFSEDIQTELSQLIPSLIEKEEDSKFERLRELLNIIPKINYSNQTTFFDSFKMVLECLKFMEVRPLTASIAKKMMEKNLFLVLIAVNEFSKEDTGFPLEELPDLLAEIPVVGEKEIAYLQESREDFLKENIPLYNNCFSVNYLLEDYIRNGNPSLVLNSYRVLSQRIKNSIEENYKLSEPETLFRNEIKKLYMIWTIAEEYKEFNNSVYLFARKRAEQYFTQSLLYSLSLLPETDAFDVVQFYKNLVSGNRLLKDNSITLLEQSLPREYFKKIDEYFYLDDDANPSKESELAERARELYKDETELSCVLRVFNDNILNYLIKANEVNHANH